MIWILNEETEELIEISECIKINKTKSTYSNVDDEFGIYLRYRDDWTQLKFGNDKQKRDNFYEHIKQALKPKRVDPNQKPVNL